jgi:hypothetical protein
MIQAAWHRKDPGLELQRESWKMRPVNNASTDVFTIRSPGFASTAKLICPTTNVGLVWHPESQRLSGLFERGPFREQVLLRRPASKTTKSPFMGTWFEKGGGMMNNCVHIAQQEDGALVAWSDDIMIPARERHANGIQPPAQTREHYGEIAKAKLDGCQLARHWRM